jgi:subtilisin-like proprotein convertase family protein/subtilisin family serine protease
MLRWMFISLIGGWLAFGGWTAAAVIENAPAFRSITIMDSGYLRDFDIAPDELYFRGAVESTFRQVPAAPDLDALIRYAQEIQTTTATEVKLVLYERNREHKPSNRRVLSKKVLVQIRPGVDAGFLGAFATTSHLKPVLHAPEFYILTVQDIGGALRLAVRLRLEKEVIAAEPLLGRGHVTKWRPNDPLFPQQWHLLNSGQAGGARGVDLNVSGVWNRWRGRGVVIGLVDDALQYAHPDLRDNCLLPLQYDFRDGDNDPAPVTAEEGHGTAVAGIIAATGHNGLGVSGVALDASLAGIRLVDLADQTDEQTAGALLHELDAIAISNNSWGPEDNGDSLEGPGTLTAAALAHGAAKGRGGRGTIYVWPAGNGREVQEDANYDGYANSIYTIAVGAVTRTGEPAPYSEPGACVVVVAPSSHELGTDQLAVVTTDLTGEMGDSFLVDVARALDPDYSLHFGGTSASTAMVSGVVGLMLEVNPLLGWRDVQEILLRSATLLAPDDPEWLTNGAGFRFHHQFGAGLVNAETAVRLAGVWKNLNPSQSIRIDATDLNQEIPDDEEEGVSVPFVISTHPTFRIEHVVVTVDIPHPRRGDLSIKLISPSGTVSRLAERHLDPNPEYSNWKLMSVFHWGEEPTGLWKVQVADRRPNLTGPIQSLRLELHGSIVSRRSEAILAPFWTGSGKPRLGLAGRFGATYRIESSGDLAKWTTLLKTNFVSSRMIDFEFEGLSNSHRYFRAVEEKFVKPPIAEVEAGATE